MGLELDLFLVFDGVGLVWFKVAGRCMMESGEQKEGGGWDIQVLLSFGGPLRLLSCWIFVRCFLSRF